MAETSITEEKLRELIDAVPDEDDPDILSYWQRVDGQYVYLEGWVDACLAGTGFPPMEEGEWDRKIAYIEDLTPEILERKAKEKNLKLLRGGFVEKTDEDFTEHLYGVTYGIYEKGGEQTASDVQDLLPMSPESGPPLPRSLGVRWPWKR